LYKLLLCWRYLLSRYLALACIISVMLGVATLIVVNSVMSGFSTKLKDRLHGLLSDVLIEAPSYEGFAGANELIERIRRDPGHLPRVSAHDQHQRHRKVPEPDHRPRHFPARRLLLQRHPDLYPTVQRRRGERGRGGHCRALQHHSGDAGRDVASGAGAAL
jgi:hypothetical protein